MIVGAVLHKQACVLNLLWVTTLLLFQRTLAAALFLINPQFWTTPPQQLRLFFHKLKGGGGISHLCEGAGVHRGGLDVQHDPVHQRFGTGHKTYPQALNKKGNQRQKHQVLLQLSSKLKESNINFCLTKTSVKLQIITRFFFNLLFYPTANTIKKITKLLFPCEQP